MTRGDIWTVAAGQGYAGKARPAVILQDDRFDATASITVCPLTTDPTDLPLFRLPFEPSLGNGLKAPSRLMVDKIMTQTQAGHTHGPARRSRYGTPKSRSPAFLGARGLK